MEQGYNIQYLSFSVAVGIVFIAGLMIQSFIVAVNVTDWLKGRPVTTADQIITSLGISRMISQFACLLSFLYDIFFKQLPVIFIPIVDIIVVASIYSNLWISTLLSVVFFLKISNFHNVFFLRLKIIIPQRVTHLIIASVLLSICLSSMFVLIFIIETPKNSTHETNKTGVSEIQAYFLALFNVVLFLICLMSSVFLISSLCHHMKIMRRNRTGTSHLETYNKTIKFITFSLLNCVFYIITNITAQFYAKLLDSVVIYFIWNILPTLHSIYLIYVTAKLRNRFSGSLQLGINCLFNRRGPVTNSGDQVETITER